MSSRYREPAQRWPERDGYRAVERMSDVVLMPADEVPDTPIEWLWPDTIPLGHVTLVAGEPASGKSFVTADVAARVTHVGEWPGHPPIQNPKSKIQKSPSGSVIFVNSNDSFDDVQQPRLKAAEAQLPLVGLMRRLPPGSRFSQFNSVGPVCDRLQALKAAIKEAGDCKLAVIDDLTHFVRDGLGKADRGDLTLALGSLRAIAGECHVAIIVVWRLERTGRTTAKYLETFLPSAAMAWLVGNDPYRPGQRWMVSLKNHFGPPCEPMAFHIADNRVVWDEPPSSVVPAEVMAPFVRKNDRRLEREQAGRWALERLAEGPVEANELFDDAEAFGFSRRTVRRALVDLGLKPTKCGNDGPWCWGIGFKVQGSGFGVQERHQEIQEKGDSRPGNQNTSRGAPADGKADYSITEPGAVENRPAIVPLSTCGASGIHGASETTFEDGQFATDDETLKLRGAESESPTTALTPVLSQRQSEHSSEIQNPKSKIQDATFEGGQLAPEDDAELLADLAQFEKNGVSGCAEKLVIVLVHRNLPGAEVSVEDGRVGVGLPPQPSGP